MTQLTNGALLRRSTSSSPRSTSTQTWLSQLMFDEFYSRETGAFCSEPSRQLQRIVNSIRHRGRALDLGCGDGRNSLYLARQGFHVTAVDYSRVGLEVLRRRAADMGVADRIDVLWCDVAACNLPRSSFDLVTAVTIFDHLPFHTIKSTMRRTVDGMARGALLYAKVHTIFDPGNLGDGSHASELAEAIRHYFEIDELVHLLPESMRTLQHGVEAEVDSSHGPTHNHVFADLLAMKQPMERHH